VDGEGRGQMPRVLLIEPNEVALVGLQRALGQAGFGDVVGAPSGSFAVTMLERDRPDLIVTRASLPDIDGYELCSIVRRDPSMAGVLLLVLAGPGDRQPAAGMPGGVDRVLVGDLAPTTIASEVASLLRDRDAAAVANRPAEEAAGRKAPDLLHGLLGIADLPDVAEAIRLAGRTGHLRVELPYGHGAIVFESGQVVHAAFADLAGEAAIAPLVMAAYQEMQGRLVFDPVEVLPTHVPRTIGRGLRHVLLGLVAQIEKARSGAAATPAS